MQSDILFKETQGFSQGFLRFLLPALVSIAVIISIIQFYIKVESLKEAILALIVLSIILVILFSFRMETTITIHGIYVQFSPFHRKPYFYPWESIKTAYIRQYNPLKEYGGWGLRTGLMGKGTACNVSGTIGIQLVFKNGNRHLIGTRKPHEAAASLKRLGKLNFKE